MGTNMEEFFLKMKASYGNALEEKDGFGEARFTDLNDWMEKKYDDLDCLETSLKDLYNKCCEALGVVPAAFNDKYPEYIANGKANLSLRLWQLGFTENAHIRGATSAYNVFKCMERDCLNGGNTLKYPIEILPFMAGGEPGHQLC